MGTTLFEYALSQTGSSTGDGEIHQGSGMIRRAGSEYTTGIKEEKTDLEIGEIPSSVSGGTYFVYMPVDKPRLRIQARSRKLGQLILDIEIERADDYQRLDIFRAAELVRNKHLGQDPGGFSALHYIEGLIRSGEIEEDVLTSPAIENALEDTGQRKRNDKMTQIYTYGPKPTIDLALMLYLKFPEEKIGTGIRRGLASIKNTEDIENYWGGAAEEVTGTAEPKVLTGKQRNEIKKIREKTNTGETDFKFVFASERANAKEVALETIMDGGGEEEIRLEGSGSTTRGPKNKIQSIDFDFEEISYDMSFERPSAERTRSYIYNPADDGPELIIETLARLNNSERLWLEIKMENIKKINDVFAVASSIYQRIRESEKYKIFNIQAGYSYLRDFHRLYKGGKLHELERRRDYRIILENLEDRMEKTSTTKIWAAGRTSALAISVLLTIHYPNLQIVAGTYDSEDVVVGKNSSMSALSNTSAAKEVFGVEEPHVALESHYKRAYKIKKNQKKSKDEESSRLSFLPWRN